MTGAMFDQSLKRLRDETDALLVDGLSRMIVTILITLGLFACGDMLIHREYLFTLFIHKLLLFVLGVGVLVALSLPIPRTRRWPRSIGLPFLAATVVSCAMQGAITGDGVTPAPLFMAFMIGTACLLPWGVLPQAILAFTTTLALIANGYAVTGHAVSAIGIPLFIAAISTFAASIYLSHFFEQQRLAYGQQGIQLATDAARVGDERLSGVNDGLWDWSVESGEVYYSSRWKEILGCSADEIAPRFDEWRGRIHPEDAVKFETDLLACINGERPRFDNEHRVRQKDGSYCWVLARGLASRNEDGPALRVAGSLTDISDRKRIEAALQESESKYRDMIENLNDVVFAVDVNAHYTYLSPAIAAMAGYAPEELLGRSSFELVHPDDVPSVVAAFERAVGTGMQAAGEFRLRTKSGAWLWARSNGRPIVSDGTVVGLRGTLTDITDRKRAEVERAAVLEVAKDASGLDIARVLELVHAHLIAMIPCDGVMTLAWEPDRHRYRVIAAHGGDPGREDIMALEFPPALPAAERFLSAGAVLINDIRTQRCLPGHLLEKIGLDALVIMPLVVQEGDLRGLCCIYNRTGGMRFTAAQVQLFEGVARHIALAMEAAGLYESQQEDAAVAAALAQFSQQMIASAHTPELLDRLCQLTTELLGCDASYTYRLDRQTDEFVPVSHFGDEPEQWEALRVLRYPRVLVAELAQQLEHDGLVDLLIEPPYEVIPPQVGELMRGMGFARTLYVPLQRGEDTFAVHQAIRRGCHAPFTRQQQRIMRGIAQVAPLALETARLFAELETANQVKEHFVVTLTHELRNPINAISGYHFLLLDRGTEFTTEQKDLIGRAERCTMELNALIVATLDLSRFQAKQVKIDWQDLVVSDLVTELSREIQVPPDKPALRLIWNPAPGVGTLHTDPLKLKMALRNLVSNAVKFTEQGHISLDVCSQDGGVEFRVSDTGIGIPAKALPALFEPFTQAHGIESRRKGGTGLGLHLVKRLVEILGGSVDVESQVGRGSTFRIQLPRDGSQVREPERTDQPGTTKSRREQTADASPVP